MTPLGLLGPLAPEWFKDNKVLGCPHPHIPSGKYFFNHSVLVTLMDVINTCNFNF